MEGDASTGCLALGQYVKLRTTLEARSESLERSDALYPMIAAMLGKLRKILDEALRCESLIIATILHPAFRIKFFHKFFGGKSSTISINAEATFSRRFREYKATSIKTKSNTVLSSPSVRTGHGGIYNVYSDEDDDPDMGDDAQLRSYLGGSDRMRDSEYDLASPKSPLRWWAVSQSSLFSLIHANDTQFDCL